VFRLAEARGSWVILHFTASWCPFCDAEVEHLGEVASAYQARNVKVVLVDVQEEQAHWLEYAKQHVAPEVIALFDATGDAARRFAPPHAQPGFEDRAQAIFDSTLILDPQGRIRLFLLPDSRHFDPTFAAVRRELDGMLAQGSGR
jgi:peroxiredoxin